MKKTIWILGPNRDKVEKVTNRVGVVMKNHDHRNVLVLTNTIYGLWPPQPNMMYATVKMCQVVREQGITPVCGFVTGHLDTQNYVFDALGAENIIICYLTDNNTPNTDHFTEPFWSDIKIPISRKTYDAAELILDHCRPKLDGVKVPNIEEIFGVCCDYVGVSTEAARSKSRHRDLVAARHLTSYFSRQLTHAHWTVIAEVIGNKHWNGVWHGAGVVEMALDPKLKNPLLQSVNYLLPRFHEMYNIEVNTGESVHGPDRRKREILRD